MTTTPQKFTPGDTVRFINPASCDYSVKPKERQRVVIEEDHGANVKLQGYNGLFHKDNIEAIDFDNPVWLDAAIIAAAIYIPFHIVYFILLQN